MSRNRSRTYNPPCLLLVALLTYCSTEPLQGLEESRCVYYVLNIRAAQQLGLRIDWATGHCAVD